MEAQRKRYGSILIPVIFVLILWVIHFVSIEFDWNLASYGLYPRRIEGLIGIFTMPFIHGGWEHLFNNSIPLLVLGWAIFHFYPSLATKTLIWITLSAGIWLWISGRSSYHIGASGVVYGLAAFLFLSGWLRREKKVASLSLLIAFLYGSMWWGILPVEPGISWEGHLWGAVAGFVLAWVFRKQGPQKKVFEWKEDEDDELSRIAMGESPRPNQEAVRPGRIVYVYKSNKPEGTTDEDEKSVS